MKAQTLSAMLQSRLHIRGGAAIAGIAAQHNISPARVRQIVKRSTCAETFDLVLHDGMQSVPVAKITTSRGFLYCCRMARRKYPGLFASLELPTWKLSAGDNTISLNSDELNPQNA